MTRAKPGLYPILYHKIPASAQKQFDRQIRFLKQFGTFIGADAAAERLEAGWHGDDRAFLMTFDDGQADNVDVALPVLRDHGVPSIQFLVSDWLEAPPARSGRADGYMTPKDVAIWLEAGQSIGSHTASHTHLSKLDTDAVRAELDRSARALSALSGAPIRHFACPWGVAVSDYLPDRDPALARASGYGTFFTTRRGRATGAADLLSMPRHVLEPHWFEYELQALLGGWKHARA